MPLIDPYRGTVGAFKPDTSGNCPAALDQARAQIRKAVCALNVIRWELIQTGQDMAATAVAKVRAELLTVPGLSDEG